MLKGYLRQDGRKGIRNYALVVYTVECAHHVAREIQYPFRESGAHVIGFHGCAPNDYANEMLQALCTHPNVGAVLIVSLGCENLNKESLKNVVSQSGRPVKTITIQEANGSRSSIAIGQQWLKEQIENLQNTPTVPMQMEELVVGTICGGSDASSGITANPVIGKVFDSILKQGATAIFEETGELIGCEHIMANRAATPELGELLVKTVGKAKKYYMKMGYGSFSDGNAKGGLSTIEEKSMGAYSKSGNSKINGIIKPAIAPNTKGLFLLDVVPDGDPMFGWPNANDNAEIAELIACGSHVVLFSTGRGSVVGSAVAPVIKICANPETYKQLSEDMDINAGTILEGMETLDDVAKKLEDCIVEVANGELTKSEGLLHQEFQLAYKKFDTLEPGCLPN
ncbi:UxaA family hydrolase [Seonamhaeicola marinus]|uniref:UxaA family hydrolase n=1 Tax=Seonamhaeicola marinus TaxID=1912246 RepID=A0A5D0IZB8_9FLAO|nr:UxaA family hydrolase [Seonamhaeicola marinus]TYA89243.1 UxaA family hydrolase [Seonamhaeicola marinus]